MTVSVVTPSGTVAQLRLVVTGDLLSISIVNSSTVVA